MTGTTVIFVLLLSAMVNALHPMITSPFPLLFGSLLGNEMRRLHTTLCVVVYAAVLFVAWAAFGMLLHKLVGISSSVSVVIALLTLAAAIIEITSFIWPAHHAMHITHEGWRKWRKHAYKLKSGWAVAGFAVRTAPWVILLAGWPFVAAMNATRGSGNIQVGTLLIYAAILVLPLLVMNVLAAHRTKISEIHQWLASNQRRLHLLQGGLITALVIVWLWRAP